MALWTLNWKRYRKAKTYQNALSLTNEDWGARQLWNPVYG